MKMHPGSSGIEVSASVLSQLVRYLSSLSMDIKGIFRKAGADPGILEHPDQRLAVETYIAIEDEAARATADSCFGLHVGEFFEPGHWSILGYMMQNCKTLGEAFIKTGRYQKIIGTLIQSSVHPGFGKVKAILSVPRHAPTLSRHCFECVLSSSVRAMRTLSGLEINPVEIEFSHPLPPSVLEYQRIFRCPVHFGRKHTSITLDMKVAGIPVLLPNKNMLDHFEDFAREYVAEIDGDKPVTQSVTHLILSQLDSKHISIGKIAREINMSTRTLQNRLKFEGTVWSRLLEDTRSRLAKKYLRQNYTVEDITYLLGFSEASVFRKAFKKWSGTTPAEYRKLAVAGARG